MPRKAKAMVETNDALLEELKVSDGELIPRTLNLDLALTDELGPNDELVMLPRRGQSPVVIDLEAVRRLAKLGMTLNQICDFFGVNPGTFERYRRKLDALDAAIMQGRAQGIAHVAHKNMQLVNNGNLVAGIFYLKAVGKWRDQDNPRDANVNQANVKVELYLPDNHR